MESINEPRIEKGDDDAKQTTLYDYWKGEGSTFEDGWTNKLIWGDNKFMKSSLLENYAGKIDLIYLDPPFATGAHFYPGIQIVFTRKRRIKKTTGELIRTNFKKFKPIKMNNDNTQDANEFVYDTDEAVKVVRNNIPKALKKKYSKKEIHFILEAEFDYIYSMGMVLDEKDDSLICDYPIDIDETKMKNYIGDKAIKKGILTNNDELSLILDAELIYYDIYGGLRGMEEYLN